MSHLTVIEAIETDFLKSLSERPCKKTASNIYPAYNEVLSNATEQQIEAAGGPLETLIDTTREHEEAFLRHVTMSLLAARGAPLEKEPAGLEGYLKAIRIPGAKKQASALKKIFSQSGKASC